MSSHFPQRGTTYWYRNMQSLCSLPFKK